MAPRDLIFNIPLKSPHKFVQEEILLAYTSDSNINLIFNLTDTTAEELVGASVKTYLYTQSKTPYQNIGSVNEDTIVYTLSDGEKTHVGITHVQFELYFVDGTVLTSPSIFIKIQDALNNEEFAEPFAYDLQAIKQEAEAELIIMRAQELSREANEGVRELGEDGRNTTFTASEGSRALTFNNNEVARQQTFEGSETNRGNTFTTNENLRETRVNDVILAANSEVNQSEQAAAESAAIAQQAMTDYLAMVGKDIATLGADGKLSASQLPALAINDTFTINAKAELTTLTAQRGDVAIHIISDTVSDAYMLTADNPTVEANWVQLGVSYVAEAGHASTATTAENADKINGHRVVAMNQAQYDIAVKDADTVYLVGG